MKKFKYLLFTSLLMVSMNVGATTLSVSLSCPASTKAGATFSCTISGTIGGTTSGGNLNGVLMKYALSGGLTYNSFSVNSAWNVYASNANGFSLGNTSGKSGSTTFGTLSVKVPTSATPGSSFTVGLNSIDCSNVDGNAWYASNVSKTIKILNSNNNLTDLKVNGTTVSSFSSGKLSYDLGKTDANSITIDATKEDSRANVSGTGKKTLNYGTNTFTITVTAENGTKKNYIVTIIKNDYRSTDNTLKSLSVNVGTINFSKNTTSYSLKVDHNVNSVTINATATNGKASVSGTGTKTLKDYANKFNIVVKAENGSTKTYSITINRRDESGNLGKLSNDNYLKSLVIKDKDISFDKSTLTYNLEVGTDLTSLDINPIPNSDSSTVTIKGNENFILGLNKVEISVKAENGEERVYTLNVTQAKVTLKMTMDEFKNLKEIKTDISVTLTDDYTLPKSLLDLIKMSKREVTFNKLDNGNLLYSICFDGNKLSSNDDTNLEVTFINEEVSKILNYPMATYFNVKDNLEGTLKVFTNQNREKLSLYSYNKSIKLEKKEVNNTNNYSEIDNIKAGTYLLTPANLEKSGTNIFLILSIVEGILIMVLLLYTFIPKKKKKTK